VNATSVWAKGLTGHGQVVGCSDTGIDLDNCFYWDHTTGQAPFTYETPNPMQRKILLYITKHGDEADVKDGHGTHVTGSIAGDARTLQGGPAEPEQYNGMAPDSKLAFTDISNGGRGLTIPLSLEGGEDGGLFPEPYEAGARIHSNSWGSDYSGYSISAQEIDRYVFDNPDFLVLFAAGNDGEKGLYSIGEPATCKNCLAVGASQNAEAAYRKANYGIVLQVARPAPCGGSVELEATAASFGPRIEGLAHGALQASMPDIEGCTAFTGDYTGKMALISRGTCSFVVKAKHAQDAGAVGFIVFNNLPGPAMAMSGAVGGDRITIPGVMISLAAGMRLLACEVSDDPVGGRNSSKWHDLTSLHHHRWAGRGYGVNGEEGKCYEVYFGPHPQREFRIRGRDTCVGGKEEPWYRLAASSSSSPPRYVVSAGAGYEVDLYVGGVKMAGQARWRNQSTTATGGGGGGGETGAELEIIVVDRQCAGDAWCPDATRRPVSFEAGSNYLFLKLSPSLPDTVSPWGGKADDIVIPNATIVAKTNATSMGLNSNASLIFTPKKLRFNATNMATFSSRGPTLDARLKPDIVAPGAMIFSARSDGKHYTHQCAGFEPDLGNSSVTTMSGTSMATPITAGLAALVRQYFTDGWYPSGAKTPADGYSPSSAVMRAMILTSGEDLLGVVDVTGGGLFAAIPAAPSFYQGHGRIQLDTVLKLSPSDPRRLYVSPPRDRPLQLGEAHQMCLSVAAGGSFKASLAWSDPPGNPLHPWHSLVNDLDLVATEASTGTFHLGNQGLYGETSSHYPDSVNNNEQIRYSNAHQAASSSISISVRLAGLYGGHTNQSYGLVIRGSFTITDPSNPCPGSACPLHNGVTCNGDACSNGACNCDASRRGSPACAPACPGNCSWPFGSCERDANGMNARCHCDKGTFGADCGMGSCRDTVTLHQTTGEIRSQTVPPTMDAGGSMQDATYTVNASCGWKIRLPDPSHKVDLTFDSFHTEAVFDLVTIHDGFGPDAQVLRVLGGDHRTTTTGGTTDHLLRVVSSGPEMYIAFNADAEKGFPGFIARYKSTPCPYACSGHGSCDPATGGCRCDAGWHGPGCDALESCSREGTCSGHGSCAADACDCDGGWGGVGCLGRVLQGESAPSGRVYHSYGLGAGHATNLPSLVLIDPTATSVPPTTTLSVEIPSIFHGPGDEITVWDGSPQALPSPQLLYHRRFTAVGDLDSLAAINSWDPRFNTIRLLSLTGRVFVNFTRGGIDHRSSFQLIWAAPGAGGEAFAQANLELDSKYLQAAIGE